MLLSRDGGIQLNCKKTRVSIAMSTSAVVNLSRESISDSVQ
jgi:hypothetical protein